MRNFLAFLGAAILTFLGIGWYLGWYNVKREAAAPGKSRLQVDIDQEKIGKDVKSGADKFKHAIDKNTSDSSTATDSTPTKPPGSLVPPSPFTPADPAARDKKKSEDVFKDLIADGWFTTDRKK